MKLFDFGTIFLVALFINFAATGITIHGDDFDAKQKAKLIEERKQRSINAKRKAILEKCVTDECVKFNFDNMVGA